MGEQRNLTEENVEELKAKLEAMKEDNPNLSYRFFPQAGDRLYIGTKLITAVAMDECTFLHKIKGQDVSNRETRAGYRVTYPDGYVSWSPSKAFESAYREVTPEERRLF